MRLALCERAPACAGAAGTGHAWSTRMGKDPPPPRRTPPRSWTTPDPPPARKGGHTQLLPTMTAGCGHPCTSSRAPSPKSLPLPRALLPAPKLTPGSPNSPDHITKQKHNKKKSTPQSNARRKAGTEGRGCAYHALAGGVHGERRAARLEAAQASWGLCPETRDVLTGGLSTLR